MPDVAISSRGFSTDTGRRCRRPSRWSSRAGPSTAPRRVTCSPGSRTAPSTSRPCGSASPASLAWASRRSSRRSAPCSPPRATASACSRSTRAAPVPAARCSATRPGWPGCRADPRAYIRPSPSAGTLGGVARATSQAMLVLEAAAYDVVLVETVGVGQSEVTVAGMVDTFLFLTLARTGDQLQGIKKGILEIADVIAVNKADGDRGQEAKAAARELAGALRLVHGRGPARGPSRGHLLGADRRRRRGRVAAGAGPPREPGPRRTGREAGRPAPRVRLGAGPRRARAAAAALACRGGHPGRRTRGGAVR